MKKLSPLKSHEGQKRDKKRNNNKKVHLRAIEPKKRQIKCPQKSHRPKKRQSKTKKAYEMSTKEPKGQKRDKKQ